MTNTEFRKLLIDYINIQIDLCKGDLGLGSVLHEKLQKDDIKIGEKLYKAIDEAFPNDKQAIQETS